MSSAFVLHPPTVVAAICDLLSLAGVIYFGMTLRAASRFQAERKALGGSSFTPPVSILKSLKGLDAEMYAALRSHCVLDYPQYELLFGVQQPEDPAVEVVKKLQREFPQRSLRIIPCPDVLGLNGKVSNLAQMLPQARYEHILINDSDIVVPPDYLRRVMVPLQQREVGMATTLYHGIAGATLGSKLEALGLSSDFAGGVLVARMMEGLRFALGATIATTKTVLNEIGGLAPLADYLGDDYELGTRTAGCGYDVALADIVVETAIPAYRFLEFWSHQLRWARNVKDRRPSQYVGLIVTFGLVWSILGVVASPNSWWTWTVLAVTAAFRLASALMIGRGVLGDERVVRDLWLVPLRDFLALAIWIASYAGNTIEWRGLRFRVRKGKLERA